MSYRFGPRLLLIISVIILMACSGDPESDMPLSFEMLTVEQEHRQTFLTFEQDSLANPTSLAFLDNGSLAVLDRKLQSVLVFDEQGERQIRFGREGKGPGEFVEPSNVQHAARFIYVADAMQFVYQKFSAEGEFITTLSPDAKPILFRIILPVGDSAFLIPADGEGGHLLRYHDMNTDSSFYFGEAMTDSSVNQSIMASKKQMSDGEIPDALKNAVYLAHHGDSYYAFLRGYARVQKYSRSGQLLWDRKLTFPFLDSIFEAAVQRNKEINGRVLINPTYLHDMKAADDGVYLMMRSIEDQNQLLVWINEEGTSGIKYVLKGLENDLRTMAVSFDGTQIFYPDAARGRVMFFDLEQLN